MKQNKHQLEHLPTLLVQQIRLQWYKDCRGGNAAAQRNQYPRAMRLPKDFFSYYPFGLPTHFASIIQRPDGFQIDRDCRIPSTSAMTQRAKSAPCMCASSTLKIVTRSRSKEESYGMAKTGADSGLGKWCPGLR